MTESTEKTTLRTGRLFYALGMVGLGGQHFYNGDFVPVIMPSFPPWVPGHYFWVCVAGIGLIITGFAIIIGKGARAAAILLGGVLAAVIVLRDLTYQVPEYLHSLGAWTNTLKALTLSGGAFVAAASLPGPGSARWDTRFISFGCFAIAVTAGAFGVDHFLYAQYVVPMVPAWVPGPLFWTYFCGGALIAAGTGMLLRIRARLAAGLLGLMIFTWLLVLHIPWAIRDPYTDGGNQWTSVFEAMSFSGIAFMLSRLLPRR
jgi:uncharacterized membrane protein